MGELGTRNRQEMDERKQTIGNMASTWEMSWGKIGDKEHVGQLKNHRTYESHWTT